MGIASKSVDLLVVGGGLAGLQAAVSALELAAGLRIALADTGGCASTEIMGFCAPLSPGDSEERFAADTLKAGTGENDPALAQVLAKGALPAVKRLERLGIQFDRDAAGGYALLRSLGSSFPRVVHHGTTTGREIIAKYRALLSAKPGVEFHSARIVKLFKSAGSVCAALGFEEGRPVCFNAKAVVLASGGAAGLFGFSTWSKTLRGSGYALALAAGAELTGLNRVQFEPCVAIHPKELYGFPVITTLLFEGAKLRDGNGGDLLDGLKELPSKKLLVEIMGRSKPCGHGGFQFDLSGVSDDFLKMKYPGYWKRLSAGRNALEVKPAAHTTLGGVKIDVEGRSSVPGLFAAGECAGGIHGADRIGGNAGLEVLVFGDIAGRSAAAFALSGARSCEGGTFCEEWLAASSAKLGTLDVELALREIGQALDSKDAAKLRELERGFRLNPPSSVEGKELCSQAFAVAKLLLD